MKLEKRIAAFSKLGTFLSQFSREQIEKKDHIEHNDLFFEGFQHQMKLANEQNGWFTKDNVLYAIEGWAALLQETHIDKWLNTYNLETISPKRVAIVMAGNIPLVGFHDFLSVLICGHNVLVKQSSNDKQLLPYLSKYLEYVEPEFKGKIKFTEEKLEDYDAVIATGSNNTARYFDYYFKNHPSLIRRNRNSIAVLTGKESVDQLSGLSDDIFRYFGLGCRNVSKLFVPENYNFDAFFEAMYKWHPVIHDQKYANNYDYNKAVYLMSEFDMLENGFLMIKEDPSYASPIATVFYEYYQSISHLKEKLEEEHDKIQCIVSDGFEENEVVFGQTQSPQLHDYADGVDTVDFLLKI